MTLGTAAAAGVRLIVWCKECQHQAGYTKSATICRAFLDQHAQKKADGELPRCPSRLFAD
jgi:hypothetical protein